MRSWRSSRKRRQGNGKREAKNTGACARVCAFVSVSVSARAPVFLRATCFCGLNANQMRYPVTSGVPLQTHAFSFATCLLSPVFRKWQDIAMYTRKVKKLFQTMDQSGDGSLNLAEFAKLVKSPKLKFWMSQCHG